MLNSPMMNLPTLGLHHLPPLIPPFEANYDVSPLTSLDFIPLPIKSRVHFEVENGQIDEEASSTNKG